MRKEREALLVAALAGMVIVGAAAFVVQPSLGGKTPNARTELGSVVLQSTTIAVAKAG